MPAAREKAVGDSLTKTVKVWTDGVELALSDFDKLDHLPHRLYLCGGGSSLQLLMDQLSQSEWYRALPFTRKPVVHHVRPEQVVGITDSTGDVSDHTFITAMGLLRVGMDTLQFTGGAKETVKDKIDKMLRV
jgi:cell division protein FtsA